MQSEMFRIVLHLKVTFVRIRQAGDIRRTLYSRMCTPCGLISAVRSGAVYRHFASRVLCSRCLLYTSRKRILLRFILNCGLFKKKRKSQRNSKGAAKPRPLCTPLGLFLECLTVAGGRVLTFVCMLRLFRVERCAD